MSLAANDSSISQDTFNSNHPILPTPKRSTNPILKLDLLKRSPTISSPKLPSPGLDFSIFSAPWQRSKSEFKSKSVINSNRGIENSKDNEFDSPKLIKNQSTTSHQESKASFSYPPSPNRMFSSTSSSTTFFSGEFVHPPPVTERSFTKFSARSDLSSAETFTSQKGKSPGSTFDLENFEHLPSVGELEYFDNFPLENESGIIHVGALNDSTPRKKRISERLSVISTLSRNEEHPNNSSSLRSPNLRSLNIGESSDGDNRRFSRRSMDFAHNMISPIEDMSWFKRHTTRSSEDNIEIPKEPEVKKWNKLASFIRKGTLKLRTSSGPRSGSSHGSYSDSPVEATNPHISTIFKQRSVDRRQTAPPGSLVLEGLTNYSPSMHRPRSQQSIIVENRRSMDIVNNRLSLDVGRSISLENPARRSISFQKTLNFKRHSKLKLDSDENISQTGASSDGKSIPIQIRSSVSLVRSPSEKLHSIREFARSSFESIRPKFTRETVETATQTSFEFNEEVDVTEEESESQIDIKDSIKMSGKFSKSMVTKRARTVTLRSTRKLLKRNSTDRSYSIERELITTSPDSLYKINEEENQESMSSEFQNSPGIISRNLDLSYESNLPILEEIKEDIKKNILDTDILIESNEIFAKKLEETQLNNSQKQSKPRKEENTQELNGSKIISKKSVMNVLRRLQRTKMLVSGFSNISHKESQKSQESESSSLHNQSRSSLTSLANFKFNSRFSIPKIKKHSNGSTLAHKLSIESLSKRQTQDVIGAVLLVVNKSDETVDSDSQQGNEFPDHPLMDATTTNVIETHYVTIKDIKSRCVSLHEVHHVEIKSPLLEEVTIEVKSTPALETRNLNISKETQECSKNLTNFMPTTPAAFIATMPRPMSRRESLADRAGTLMPKIPEGAELNHSENLEILMKSTNGPSMSLCIDTIKSSNIDHNSRVYENLDFSRERHRSEKDSPRVNLEYSPVVTEASDVYYSADSDFGMEERRDSMLSNSSSPAIIQSTEMDLCLSNQKENEIMLALVSEESGEESLDIELNEEDFSTSKLFCNLKKEKSSVIQKIFTDLKSRTQNLDVPTHLSIPKNLESIPLNTNNDTLEKIDFDVIESSYKESEQMIQISKQDTENHAENETQSTVIFSNTHDQINNVPDVQEREVNVKNVVSELSISETSESSVLGLDSNIKVSEEHELMLKEKNFVNKPEQTDRQIEIMFDSEDQEKIVSNAKEVIFSEQQEKVDASILDEHWIMSALKFPQAKEISLPAIIVERPKSHSSQSSRSSLETPHVPETPHPHAVPGFIFPSPTPILSCDEDEDSNFPEVYYTNDGVESPQATPRSAYENIVSEEYVLLKTKRQPKAFPKEKFHPLSLLTIRNMDLSDDESGDTPYNFSFPSSSIIPPLSESFGRRRSSRLRTFSQNKWNTYLNRSDSIDSAPASVRRRWSAPNVDDEEENTDDYQIELKSIRPIRSKTDSSSVFQDEPKLDNEKDSFLETKSEEIERISVINISPPHSETNVTVLSDPEASIAKFTSFQEFATTCKTPTNAESSVESDYFNTKVSTWHPWVTVEGKWGDTTDNSLPSPIHNSPSVTPILLPIVTPKASDSSFATLRKLEMNQNGITRNENNNYELNNKLNGKKNMETNNMIIHKVQVHKNIETKNYDEAPSQAEGQRQKRNRRKKSNKKGINVQTTVTEGNQWISKNISSTHNVPANMLLSPVAVENKNSEKTLKVQTNLQVNRAKGKPVQPHVNGSQTNGKQSSMPVRVFVTLPEEEIVKKSTNSPNETVPIAPLSAAAALSYFDSDKAGSITVVPKWQPRIFSKGSPFGGDENWRYEDSIERTQPQFIQQQYHYQHQNQPHFVPEYYPQQHYISNEHYGQTASSHHGGKRYGGKTPKN
ncbi:hypothetical protein HK096_005235 [Nowakowskiella sp. JEL0078]|nr:hypothetical protein HK096_005235 [Nowakowskiella sp. JEL0078]